MTAQVLGRFVREQRHERSTSSVVGLSRVVAFLRDREVISTPEPNASQLVLEAFRRYLREERRLAELTVVTSADVVRRFLAYREARGGLRLAELTVGDVHGFVLDEAHRLHRGSISPALDATRSFLRFLFATGVHERDLAGTLPSVTAMQHPTVPRAVDRATLTALLDSCDRSTTVGLRDFAILTLLSRLGLRAVEVAAMQLDDIIWRAGELTVHGKGGRTDQLPLPVDVGQALARYLKHGRPASLSRAVFLRIPAPAGPLSRNGVVFVSRSASRRAGLPVVGAHRLRHTAASQMLQAGASLSEVGQVLRHERDQTTTLYASVDPRGLKTVVRDWPGASS